MVLIIDGPLKVSGAILMDGGSGSGWTQIADTLQCKHCQKHWQVVPGSGRQRGWCRYCDGPTCGAERCCDCQPFEVQMEIMEGRLSLAASLHNIKAL